MFGSAFQKRIQRLARHTGLKIAELRSSSAQLLFTVGAHTRPLFIIDYDGVWEFSCPTRVAVENVSDIPRSILEFALEQNAQNKRGFWCIETIQGKKTLEYMHNFPEDLLTSDEFSKICWGAVRQVEALETSFKALLAFLVIGAALFDDEE